MLGLILLPMLAVAPAQGEVGGKFVVLVRADEGEVPDGWNEALQGVATSAASELPDAEVLPPPQVGLKEVELAVGCEGWGPKCAGKIALMLDADYAVVAQLTKRGRGAWFSTSVFNREGKLAREGARYELPDREAAGLELAKEAVRAAIMGAPPTSLVVDTDVPGVAVFFDGKRVGSTPWVGRKLSPGEHQIRLELEGRAPVTKTVTLDAGETERVAVVMGSGPNPVRTPAVGGTTDSGETGPVPPAVAWTMLGVGGAVFAAGLATVAMGLGNQVFHTTGFFPGQQNVLEQYSPFYGGAAAYPETGGVDVDSVQAVTAGTMLIGVVAVVVGGIAGGSGIALVLMGGEE